MSVGSLCDVHVCMRNDECVYVYSCKGVVRVTDSVAPLMLTSQSSWYSNGQHLTVSKLSHCQLSCTWNITAF